MDNYTKYGLLAAGAIAVYMIAKNKGLADDAVRDDSYEELAKDDAYLSGMSKRKRTARKKSLRGSDGRYK